MKTFASFLFSLALMSIAHAGSLSIQIVSGSPAFNATKTFTIPDSDMAKFFAFVQAKYTAPPCTPVAPATTCVTTSYTLAQSLVAWATAFMQGTADNVQTYQNNLAIQQLAPAAPISVQ